MSPEQIAIGLVGIGEIARKQHIPALENSDEFELVAAASRDGSVENIDNFQTISQMLRGRQDLHAVSLCTPPAFRFDMAWAALSLDKHVMLEKPPGATLSEVEALDELANSKGLTLFATWHSRYAPGVERARDWLSDKTINRIQVDWKEDVKRWHPGQKWIWEAGGMGVFDPGINALSILTYITPAPFHLSAAKLEIPSNSQTPIAAELEFRCPTIKVANMSLDWRKTGKQSWDIRVETQSGTLLLSEGGSKLSIAEQDVPLGPEAEYDALYERFASLVENGQSDVDLAPMRHVADAFTLGKRTFVEAFHE